MSHSTFLVLLSGSGLNGFFSQDVCINLFEHARQTVSHCDKSPIHIPQKVKMGCSKNMKLKARWVPANAHKIRFLKNTSPVLY